MLPKKEIKKTFNQWYKEIWSTGKVFCVTPPSKKDENLKITKKEFVKYMK